MLKQFFLGCALADGSHIHIMEAFMFKNSGIELFSMEQNIIEPRIADNIVYLRARGKNRF